MLMIMILVALVLTVTIVLTLKSRGRKAPLGPVIMLYGLGMSAVLVVGGVFLGFTQQRTYDNCVIAVKGRDGVRGHFSWLYDYIAQPRDPTGTIDARTAAFLDAAHADLDKRLPDRTLQSCGEDPSL